MSADQTTTKARVASEDEDLFDFPVIEMKLEGEAEPRSPIPAAKSEVATTATPAAVMAAQAAPAAAPVTAAPKTAPAPAATTTTAAPAGSEPKSLTRSAMTMRPLLIALAVFAAINIGGMVFLWNASVSLRQGLDQLRTTPVQTPLPSVAPAAEASNPAPNLTPAPLAPMESFDTTALRLAREEIRTGNPIAARRRLAQLLAVIDRVDPQQRAGVESDALYLSAQALEAALQLRQGDKQ